ncbi:MAG: DUF1499 domain-containing protein [Pseudomonadota bacterium]
MNNIIGANARRQPVRSAGICLWLGIIGTMLAVGGSYGSGQGFWPFTIGLLMVVSAFLLGIIGGLTGLFAAIRNRRGSGLGRRIMIGMLLCGAVLAGIGPWIHRGIHFPPIHDVTTDLDNPPLFAVLAMRSDNLAGVGSLERWRELHREAYSDIAPITVGMKPAAVIARAKTLATTRGWDVMPTSGDRVEATAIESPFKFKDDVVIVATPTADGQSTIVNMRSVSRVGESDFGINAKRIREFLTALKK